MWEWTADREGPVCACAMPTPDLQTCVRVNPHDTRQLVTNGQDRVVFWSWEEGKVRVCWGRESASWRSRVPWWVPRLAIQPLHSPPPSPVTMQRCVCDGSSFLAVPWLLLLRCTDEVLRASRVPEGPAAVRGCLHRVSLCACAWSGGNGHRGR